MYVKLNKLDLNYIFLTYNTFKDKVLKLRNVEKKIKFPTEKTCPIFNHSVTLLGGSRRTDCLCCVEVPM